MDQFCGSKFWDANLTWYTDAPDLTPCFQKTVLVWATSTIPLITIPIAVLRFLNANHLDNKPPIKSLKLRDLTRMMISLLLVLIEVVILTRHAIHFVDDLGCGIRIFNYVTISCLHRISNNETVRISGLLTSFWLFSTICDFISFQSVIRIHLRMHVLTDVNEFEALITARFVFMLLQTALHCLPNRMPELFSDQVKGPRTEASILSQLFFCWTSNLIFKGFRQPLKLEDFFGLDTELTSESVSKKFEAHWIETAGKSRRLLRTLVALCGYRYSIALLIICFIHFLDVASAFTVRLVVNFANGTEETWKGYLYAFTLFLLPFISEIANEYQLFTCTKCGVCTKAALRSAIYKKSMVMSTAARSDYTTGKLMNFMSVDAEKIGDVYVNLDKILTSPLRVLLATWFMWYFVGWASFAGVAVLVVLVVLSYCIGRYDKVYIKKEMQAKDKRLSLVGSIITGIKLLKLNAWEESFERKVKDLRKKETKTMKKSAVIQGAVEFLWMSSQVWVVFAILSTYIMSHGWERLDASTIFVILAVCGNMCQFMTKLPKSISAVFQANVCLDRLEYLLKSEDRYDFNVQLSSMDPWTIKMEQLTVSWGQTTPVLHNISLHVQQGSLVAVVGAVGTGKSSLLATIVNEIHNRTGTVEVKGSVGYCKQLPWIQNGTVRENILFGLPYSSVKYQQVMKACGLTDDVNGLPAGDCTEIGERVLTQLILRGVNLSGGQNQRIALARVVYQDADAYLLDDPLSAVDTRLGKEIFDNVIGPRGILCTKTRVLVTTGLNFLHNADMIVLLKQFGLVLQMSYDEFVKKHEASMQDAIKFSSMQPEEANYNQEITPELLEGAQLVVKESSNVGEITWSTYLAYARSAGWKFVIPAVVVIPFYQAFSLWGNACLKSMSDCNDTSSSGCLFYLLMYLALSVPQYFTLIVSIVSIAMVTLEASTNLHSRMLSRLLKAPTWIFDTTPSGRIINRFSGDIHILDHELIVKFRVIPISAAAMVTTIGVIAYTVPMFIFVCFPGAALYYLLQRLYSPCIRQIRRLESVSLSPIMSYFEETLTGVTIIRTHQQQGRFLREFLQRIDKHHQVSFCRLVCDRWFLTRMSTLTGMIKLAATLLVVNFRNSISPGLVGLTITYTLNLTYHCATLFRELCYIKSHFVPVERVKEFTKLPQECDCECPSVIPYDWPRKGEVRFVNYETKYRPELDLSLRTVHLHIHGGEKVGVVGRTGAGKSTLSLALFRILEAAGGHIFIDDIDIATVPLQKLRSMLSIIPQNPVLFVGTLRFNLDPFNEYPDEQIWKALEATHLKSFISTCPGQLNFEIAEDAANLSVGQKQLVCFARAVLRNSKILVLDEATASIDPATDELIQRTIKSAFQYSTVITIAHRLRTILDYDRIAVVDHASVLEFDSPQSLLADESSLFFKMATSAGISPESELSLVTRL